MKTSLTSPTDAKSMTTDTPTSIDRSSSPLPSGECKVAFQTLQNKDNIEGGKFYMRERRFVDPPIADQKYCLVSFTPSQDAKPDKNGIFGMMKVRGSYSTDEECEDRMGFLIRDVDSYNTISQAYVGKPFPVTTNNMYSQETVEFNLEQEKNRIFNQNILKQKKEEQSNNEELEYRKKMMEEASELNKLEEENMTSDQILKRRFETYITLRVKRATTIDRFIDNIPRMQNVLKIICSTDKELAKMDEEYPNFINNYRDQLLQEHKKNHITKCEFYKYLEKPFEEIPELHYVPFTKDEPLQETPAVRAIVHSDDEDESNEEVVEGNETTDHTVADSICN